MPGGPAGDPERFAGIGRDYTPADVERLAGTFRVRHTLAEMGARRLWHLLKTEPFVNTLGALTGNQAVQQVKAGLKAIYLSGWQVAADANTGGPDVSRPVAVSGRTRCRPWCAASTTRCAAATRSRSWRATPRHLLDGADRRRRRSRVRRRAERLRADEGDDRGRRRRRAFRGPARLARRSAAISAARCWCRSASTSAR